MSATRRTLFTVSVALSMGLMLGAFYYEHLRGIYGKEWTIHGLPAATLQVSYLLSMLAFGTAFTGRSWYRLLGIALAIFALLCWLDAGLVP